MDCPSMVVAHCTHHTSCPTYLQVLAKKIAPSILANINYTWHVGFYVILSSIKNVTKTPSCKPKARPMTLTTNEYSRALKSHSLLTF